MEHTAKEVHGMLAKYFRGRPDLGLWKGILDLALEPRNPFEPGLPRKLRRDFVLVVVLAGMPAGAFVYFNFWI
jgi:hypothetical protein